MWPDADSDNVEPLHVDVNRVNFERPQIPAVAQFSAQSRNFLGNVIHCFRDWECPVEFGFTIEIQWTDRQIFRRLLPFRPEREPMPVPRRACP